MLEGDNQEMKKEEKAPQEWSIQFGPRYDLVPTEFYRMSRNRVKLYVCKEGSAWDDAGTGHVNFWKSREDGSWAIVFRLESSDENKLESMVRKAVYQRQQLSLVVWNEDSMEIALSFQDEGGCEGFYGKLGSILGKAADADYCAIDSDSNVSEEIEDEEMPPIQFARLGDLEVYIKERLFSVEHRERIARDFESKGMISDLIDVFQMVEDMEDIPHLNILHSIIKHLFLLNQESLVRVLFQDENLRHVIGMLEYDPSRKERAKYREFLYEKAQFREVLPFQDQELRNCIHKLYRVQFVKDQCMPPPSIFDVCPTAALVTYIKELRSHVCSRLRTSNFIGDLIGELKKETLAEERRRDLMLLFAEFMDLSVAPGTSPIEKQLTFEAVFSSGAIAASVPCISLPDPTVQRMAVENILKLAEFEPSTLVYYLHEQGIGKAAGDTLAARLAMLIFTDKDPHLTVGSLVLDIFRLLLAPENPYPPEQEIITTEFYNNVLPCLSTPLLDLFEGERPKQESPHWANVVYCATGLLIMCAQRHFTRIRGFIVGNDLLADLVGLIQSKHHFLAINVVKLLRQLIAAHDASLFNYFVRNDLFQPVVASLRKQRLRNNLLLSVLLELFEFIAMEDAKLLLFYLMKNYGNVLEGLLGGVFPFFKKRYEVAKKEVDERNEELKREAEEKWFDENENSAEQTTDKVTSPKAFVEMPKSTDDEDDDVFTATPPRPKTALKIQIQYAGQLASKKIGEEAVKKETKALVDYGDSDSDEEKEEPEEEKKAPVPPMNPSTPRPLFRGSKRPSVEFEDDQMDAAKKACN